MTHRGMRGMLPCLRGIGALRHRDDIKLLGLPQGHADTLGLLLGIHSGTSRSLDFSVHLPCFHVLTSIVAVETPTKVWLPVKT